MDRLLISRIFQTISWSLWAFLKHCNQIINAKTCSTTRNRGKGTHEDSLRFCGESQDYFFTAGFALGLCCWVRGTKGEQPLCKHHMSSLSGGLSCQWQWCETWSITSCAGADWAFQRTPVWGNLWQSESIYTSTRVFLGCVCGRRCWRLFALQDNAGEWSRGNSATQGHLPPLV